MGAPGDHHGCRCGLFPHSDHDYQMDDLEHPLVGGAIAFVVIRKKKLECPYCHMVYIPPRWDSSVHYRCRNCRRIIYYDDDGDVEEAEI